MTKLMVMIILVLELQVTMISGDDDYYDDSPCNYTFSSSSKTSSTWVVVKIMLPFWVLNIIRHLIFKVPEKGP